MGTQRHSTDIVFLSGRRTPFGSFGGTLKAFTATDLGVHAATAALESAGVESARVDHVVFGNALQTSSDAIYLARHVGLRAGVPVEVPALTLNRLCGSGFQAIVSGSHQLPRNHAWFTFTAGSLTAAASAPSAHGFFALSVPETMNPPGVGRITLVDSSSAMTFFEL